MFEIGWTRRSWANHQTSTPQKTKPCSLVIHQWHAVIWLVGNSKYLQYENWRTDFRNSSKILHFSSQWGVVPNNFVTNDSWHEILFWSHISLDMTQPIVTVGLLGPRFRSTFSGKVSESTWRTLWAEGPPFVFFLFFGRVEYMVVDFFLMKNTLFFFNENTWFHSRKKDNTQMFEVGWWCPRNKDDFDRFVQDEFEGWRWWNPLHMISDQDLSL